MNDSKYLVSFLLRLGLAVAFLYAAVAAILDPTSWVGFIPLWLRDIIPGDIFLIIHSVGEIVLALWLLSGKRTYLAALLASAAMFFIIIFNFGALDIVFRDVAILFMAIALAVLTKSEARNPKS